jgi:hypothetical protein
MADVQYGIGCYRRTHGHFAELRLVNLYPESSPVDRRPVPPLISRKGLSSYATWGPGLIRGVFRQSGVFGGDLFALSGCRSTAPGRCWGRSAATGRCRSPDARASCW